jgi:hypothetical protein
MAPYFDCPDFVLLIPSVDGMLISSQERVLKDAEQMIPRTQKSLEQAREALEDLVVSRRRDT